MNCQQFREMIDSYISDELLVETNHDVLHHLENCGACRQELAAHRHLRARLRTAVKDSSEMRINPAFAARLKASLRETAQQPKWWGLSGKNKTFLNLRTLSFAAFGVLLIAGFAVVWKTYQNSSPDNSSIAGKNTNDTVESNITVGNLQTSQSPISQAVQIAWREITAFAVGDHKNCALQFRLKENPISLEAASKKYGKFNKDLDQAVIKPLKEIFPRNTAGEIKLLESHSCVFEGRRFAHIVLRRQNHIISVLVTKTDLPAAVDDRIVNQTEDDLQVAGFRTRHYAVFIVSDLPASENFTVAQSITAGIRQQIEKSEI